MIGLGIRLGLQESSTALPFKPTDVAGIVLWLDAAKGITKTGSNVTTWADQSGAGFDLNAQDGVNVFGAATGPNSLPSVAFAAGSLYRAAPLVTGANHARAVWCVCKSAITATFQVVHADGDDNTVEFTYANNLVTPDSRQLYTPGSSGAGFVTDTTSVLSSAWESVMVSNGPGQLQRLRVNGAEHALSASGELMGNIAGGNFSIGGTHTRLANPYVGGIAEVIAFNVVPSAPDIAKIDAYLFAKYGT